jgi:predicted  nucleic acid-binding Zn-ribbon protein
MILRFFQHRKQIDELRQDFDKLRKEFSVLELEWADMFDRMRRMLMKISKRQEREEDTRRVDGDAETETPIQPGSSRRTSLTPRQLAWQERILRNRAGRAKEETE